MINENDCKNRRQAITALVLGELDSDGTDELKKHIESCKECKSFYQELADEEKTIVSAFETLAHRSEILQRSIIEQFDHNEYVKDQKTKNAEKTIKIIWRKIMKNPVTKYAAAAVFLLGIFIGAHFLFSSTQNIVWADVVKPILTARTVVFNVIATEGENVPITKVMNMGTQRLRCEVMSPDGRTVQAIAITDFDTSRTLTLNPNQKIAALIDLKDLPEKPENILDEMRNIITDLQNDPDVLIEQLGEQEIDGQIATVFHATGPDEELTIWADSQTALPIRIEQKGRQIQFTCTDFQFDIEMDESLFSMEIPEGYPAPPMVGEIPISEILGGTEQDLVEFLRIYAESILDGVFPEDLSPQVWIDDVKKNRNKFAQLSEEQNLEGPPLEFARGWVFFRLLKAENDWHYVGGGVKLGDAESPVCWYRPDGSQTYRVIYGDLNVKDIAPEDLPK